jgi:hypothetical protein
LSSPITLAASRFERRTSALDDRQPQILGVPAKKQRKWSFGR